MRNPNGYGGIKKLSGNRRKPYAACITKEWTDDGKQIVKYIGYYATRKEAVQALAEYNADPFSATADKTFKEIYDGWHKDYFFGDYNAETERNYSKGFKRAKQLHDKVFVQIRLTELQDYIDTLPSHDQARRFKALVSMMSEWAIARDYARKNYAEGVVIKQVQKKNKQHRRVADADIEKIFTINTRAADIIKIDLYAGCRISELLNLKSEDLHLDEKWFYIRDSKQMPESVLYLFTSECCLCGKSLPTKAGSMCSQPSPADSSVTPISKKLTSLRQWSKSARTMTLTIADTPSSAE